MLFLLIFKNKINSALKTFHIQSSSKSLSDWNDYYPTIQKPANTFSNLTYNVNNTLSPQGGDSYVFNCLFCDMLAENGAAILYNVQGSNLLVEKCSIYNCTAINYTAGIRVNAGNCIIAYVCSQYGYAGLSDGFCSICDDNSRNNNSVYDSSISHCTTNGWFTMTHSYGNIYIKSVNLSHNQADAASALGCAPFKINEATAHGSDVLYCSFANNTASTSYCIRMTNELNNSSSITHSINYCNIILNKGANLVAGDPDTDAQTNIYSCCIMKNTLPVFYGLVSLFNCTIGSNQLEGSNMTGITDSLNSTTFLHNLTFISTGSCVHIPDTINDLSEKTQPFNKFSFKNNNHYII